MSEGWTQFLLVAVPVLSLVGSWMALKAWSDTSTRRDNKDKDGEGNG